MSHADATVSMAGRPVNPGAGPRQRRVVLHTRD